jgi:hypothetical protein
MLAQFLEQSLKDSKFKGSNLAATVTMRKLWKDNKANHENEFYSDSGYTYLVLPSKIGLVVLCWLLHSSTAKASTANVSVFSLFAANFGNADPVLLTFCP